ncbi:hypothetical protein AVEN_146305-1 [Araneus ventricosus]|uniref:Uncharacterized protein n=1 Tax=Araneus ventricosus TaxID=182803 RepID=A0A4Y2I0K8_ARAVE|nr:hypothetical protein AVEN_146305-1 [Araneus ventricosus]
MYDPSSVGVQAKSDVSQTSSRWCGAEVWRRECRFRCRPHHLTAVQARGGLVIRSRPRDRRVPGLKPDSTEEPPCKWVWCTLNPSAPHVLPLVWCESLERERGGASSDVVLVI